MREIKFRAYTDKGEMIYNYCQLIGNRFYGEDMANTNYGNIIDIMQFTGLHDCEGKEIYEYDLINDKNIVLFDKKELRYIMIDISCGDIHYFVEGGIYERTGKTFREYKEISENIKRIIDKYI